MTDRVGTIAVDTLKILKPAEGPRPPRSVARTSPARRHELTDVGRAVLAEIGLAA